MGETVKTIQQPGGARRQKLLAALAGALVGCVVFLWLYGTSTLHVTYDGWILNGYDETDIQQHYAGWVLFRNSHWGLPLGMADTIAAPDGTVISFTDSLPWASIFFKALRGVLPGTFQWFGLYTLLCFMLQGAAGCLLVARRTLWGNGRAENLIRPTERAAAWAMALLGGLLFACSPVLWERAFRHVALASHYLYLFALYFYLEYRRSLTLWRQGEGTKPRLPWQFAALGFLAVGIHPYFLPGVLMFALLAGVARFQAGHTKQDAVAGAGQLALAMAAALVGGVACGALGSGVSASRYGYGSLSMNLDAVINPISRGEYTWSKLLPVLPRMPDQYDGFNYLGAGTLVLALGALGYCIFAALRHKGTPRVWLRRNAALLVCSLILTLFALSNNVYAGGKLLVAIPFPAWLVELCGVFRSSGRIFYPVGACILLFGIYTLLTALTEMPTPPANLPPCQAARLRHAPRMQVAALLLCCVAAVQLWDLSAVRAQKRAIFNQSVSDTVVTAEATQNLGAGHTKLLCADTALREDRLRRLAILAGKQGLGTNLSIAVSGEYPGAAQSVADAAALLASGQFDPATVYVTTDGAQYEEWQRIFAAEPAVTLFVADSCYFLVPIT